MLGDYVVCTLVVLQGLRGKELVPNVELSGSGRNLLRWGLEGLLVTGYTLWKAIWDYSPFLVLSVIFQPLAEQLCYAVPWS